MLAVAAFFSSSLLWCSWLAANGNGSRNCKTQGEAEIVAKDKPQGSPGDFMVVAGIQVNHTDGTFCSRSSVYYDPSTDNRA